MDRRAGHWCPVQRFSCASFRLLCVEANFKSVAGGEYLYEKFVAVTALPFENDFTLAIEGGQHAFGAILDGEFTEKVGFVQLLPGNWSLRCDGTAQDGREGK